MLCLGHSLLVLLSLNGIDVILIESQKYKQPNKLLCVILSSFLLPTFISGLILAAASRQLSPSPWCIDGGHMILGRVPIDNDGLRHTVFLPVS